MVWEVWHEAARCEVACEQDGAVVKLHLALQMLDDRERRDNCEKSIV
jgi:hypothetical protein